MSKMTPEVAAMVTRVKGILRAGNMVCSPIHHSPISNSVYFDYRAQNDNVRTSVRISDHALPHLHDAYRGYEIIIDDPKCIEDVIEAITEEVSE